MYKNRNTMDPITASIAARGVLSLGQLALAQTINTKRPTMQVPGAINEMVSGQRMAAGAGTDLIQQGYNQEVGQEAANAANTISRTAKSGSDAIQGVASVAANATKARRAGALDFAGRKVQNQQMLNQGLGILGGYQQQVWDYNVNQPYQARVATRNALTQSALGNAFDAVDMGAAYGTQMQGYGAAPVAPPMQFQQTFQGISAPKLFQYNASETGDLGLGFLNGSVMAPSGYKTNPNGTLRLGLPR